MCGISGFIASRPNKAKVIADMTNIISHRGPDGEGFVIFENLDGKAIVSSGNKNSNNDFGQDKAISYLPTENLSDKLELLVSIALGHRRLSIVELSYLGHQPMCFIDGDLWITFNGEIYNHREIRIELEKLGYVFNSNSDTEVILAAYKEWGYDCLNKFNGMWAFAIYDVVKAELFIARDRFGVKPLYYWISPEGNFYFVSEIKQLTVLPEWEANLNHQMAYDFLAWGLCDHTNQTMFKDVYQLVGGNCLSLNINQFCSGNRHAFSEWKWYILKKDTFNGTFKEAQQIFKTLFDDAVKLRLRADVEIGTGLSGGLDSSSIVCTINNQLNDRQSNEIQNTFSACVADKRYDERNFMEIIEKHASVKAHYVYPQISELFNKLDKLIWHQDEPFAGTSIFAESCVFELVSKTPVKVTLDGHGADEILAGYHVFFAHELANLLCEGRFISFFNELRALNKRFNYTYKNLFLSVFKLLIPKFLIPLIGRYSPENDRAGKWIDFNKLKVIRRNPFIEKGENKKGIRTLSETQLLYTSLPVQLHWADRDSMTFSIESRAPFLDYRIVEFALSCPDHFKLKKGVTKRLLRESMKDILPRQISARIDKMGFVTPEPSWVKEQASEIFRKEIKLAITNSKGILGDEINSISEKIIMGNIPYDPIVWRCICFGHWMKIFSINS